MKPQYEVIIVGGSYAGLAAGMALGRALRRVLIIDAGEPCNRFTPYSHNFLTNDGRRPEEIAAIAKQELTRYTTLEFTMGLVKGIERENTGFIVAVNDGSFYTTAKVILATGIKDILPDLPGIDACWGKSVLHCPYCHGYEVRNEKTGILGNGEAGYELAVLLSQWTSHLTLFTNGNSTLNPEQSEMLRRNGIKICEEKLSRLEHNGGQLENIVTVDNRNFQLAALYMRPSSEQHIPTDQMLQTELTEEGYLKIDMAYRTTVPGLFACGDNSNRMRTVATAVAAGTMAAFTVNRELIEERFTSAP